jgi:hypothetical protein
LVDRIRERLHRRAVSVTGAQRGTLACGPSGWRRTPSSAEPDKLRRRVAALFGWGVWRFRQTSPRGAAAAPPLVSVAVSTWNRPELAGRAVRSVLAQVFGDPKRLVVDDESTDRTAEVV